MNGLDSQDRKVLEALEALGNGWHTRADVAAKLGVKPDSYGKYRLSPEKLLSLEWLVTAKQLDKSKLRLAGYGLTIAYRIHGPDGAQ